MCPSINHLSVLCGEILRRGNDVVWAGKSVVFWFGLFVVGTAHLTLSQLSAYTDSALLKTKSTMTHPHHHPRVPARANIQATSVFVMFTLS